MYHVCAQGTYFVKRGFWRYLALYAEFGGDLHQRTDINAPNLYAEANRRNTEFISLTHQLGHLFPHPRISCNQACQVSHRRRCGQ